MATTIVLKNSVTTTNTPSSLAQGEVAINVTDKKVWVGNAATTPIQIVNGGPDGVFTSVTDSGLTNTRVTYAGAGGLLKDSANITTDGTIITAAFSGAHNGTVGATTPSTGAFTTVSASSTVTGTALIPSGSGAPTNGVFLPTTNAVGFSTNSTEVGRFNSSGQFLLATTSGTMSVTGKSPVQRIYNSGTSILGLEAGSTGNYNIILFNNPNGEVGVINTNGSGTSYGTTSDYRLKTNVQPMQNALETVSKLNPVTYTWKVDNSAGQGFIAHELQEFVPDCVNGEKDALNENGSPKYQNIDTSYLVATLTKAIQEINIKVDAQVAQIAALKSGV